jgi:hypothetical protein
MVDILAQLGFDNVEQAKNKIVVKVSNSERLNALTFIIESIGGYHDVNSSYSSIGCIVKDQFKIIIKPIEKQGDGSAGKPNENFLFNKLIENPVKQIVFTSDKKNIVINDVVNVNNCSKKSIPKNRLKTDIEIFTENSKFNISLKQDNAEIWESADSYCSKLVHTYVNYLEKEKKINLECNEYYCKVKPEIGIECNEKEAMDVIFGEDIYNQGTVITKTFCNDDFLFEKDSVNINVSSIIENLDDLKSYQKPFFHIRNDKTRNCGIKGLRTLAVYQKRINPNVLKILKEERID